MRKLKFIYALLAITFLDISIISAETTELIVDYSYTKSPGNWINYKAEISEDSVDVSFSVSILKIANDKIEQNHMENSLSFKDDSAFYKLSDIRCNKKISENEYDFFDFENSLTLINGSQKCVCIISNWEDLLNHPDYLHELDCLMELHIKILSQIAERLNCKWTDMYSQMDRYQ